MSFVISQVDEENPTDHAYMLQASVAELMMLQHTERLPLSSTGLKNASIDFLQDQSKIATASQVAFDGAGVFLDLSATPTVVDALDSVTGWGEITEYGFYPSYSNAPALETTIKTEGTGSLKFRITEDHTGRKVGFYKTLSSSENWSAHNFLKIDCQATLATNHLWYLRLKNSSGSAWVSGSFVMPVNTFNTVSIDYSMCPSSIKTAVKEIALYQVQNGEGEDYDNYFDNMRRVATTHYSSGYIITNTVVTTVTDITHIYFSKYEDLPADGDIVYKVSLDGGTTYHTLVSAEFGAWVDVSGWAESFSNKKNLKIRIDLSTTDTAVTPVVDDYFIQWKVQT